MSFWRFTHLTLAILTAGFLIVACLTGIVLSFEPIKENLNEDTKGKQRSIASLLPKLQHNFDEVFSLKINEANLLEANVIDENGDFKDVLISPVQGKEILIQKEPHPIFDFCRKLHRSLFLENTGRMLMGIVSGLLILMSISGIYLVKKHQLKWRYFFHKIEKSNRQQFYHTQFGRFMLLPILIISLSGLFLSLKRFEVIPSKVEIELENNDLVFDQLNPKDISTFDIFNETKISELVSLEFPFSPDLEDYFYLTTKSHQYYINQFNGKILASKSYGTWHSLYLLNFELHTGSIHPIWAVILLVSCVVILYFIYSGFRMTCRRTKHQFKNKIKPNKAKFVILYGSESGLTKHKAIILFNAISSAGHNVYMSALNEIASFESMEHLIILTSTYGEGEAPANADKFFDHFSKIKPTNYTYTIIGFGSKAYADFCGFAQNLDLFFSQQEGLQQLVKSTYIHNQSAAMFLEAIQDWQNKASIDFTINELAPTTKHTSVSAKVQHKTSLDESTSIFQISFTHPSFKKVASGDLFIVLPPGEMQERSYSIGKVDHTTILITVKKHDRGICSNYLFEQEINNSIEVRIQQNKSFHVPKAAKEVVFIANGSGIGPFLQKKHQKQVHHLFFGVPNKKSASILLQSYKSNFEHVHLALSKEMGNLYVQDLLKSESKLIVDVLSKNGVLMICGSLAMRNAVYKELNDILLENNFPDLEHYKNAGQILDDCY